MALALALFSEQLSVSVDVEEDACWLWGLLARCCALLEDEFDEAEFVESSEVVDGESTRFLLA